MIASVNATQILRCPKCKQPVTGLILMRGNIYTEQGLVLVKSFQCGHCKKIIHWSERK